MSATISIIFSRQGIKNQIICGDMDNDPYFWHAMLKAIVDGDEVWIESTNLTWSKENPYLNWITFGTYDGLSETGEGSINYGPSSEWRPDWNRIKSAEEEIKKNQGKKSLDLFIKMLHLMLKLQGLNGKELVNMPRLFDCIRIKPDDARKLNGIRDTCLRPVTCQKTRRILVRIMFAYDDEFDFFEVVKRSERQ